MGHAISANASAVLGVLDVAWGLLLVVLGMVDSKFAPQLLHLVLHRHPRGCRTLERKHPRQTGSSAHANPGIGVFGATEYLVL